MRLRRAAEQMGKHLTRLRKTIADLNVSEQRRAEISRKMQDDPAALDNVLRRVLQEAQPIEQWVREALNEDVTAVERGPRR
jgi:Sec-independent protein translocase protein TatA